MQSRILLAPAAFALLAGCAATPQRAPRAQVDYPEAAPVARAQFSRAMSCPESRITTTPADPLAEPLPPEIAADPERAAVYRANHAADRREVFDVAGCDTRLRLACDGVGKLVFCVPVMEPVAAARPVPSLREQIQRALPPGKARLGILRTSVSGKVVVGVVVPGTPADGKLRPADVIIRAGGEPVPDAEALAKVVQAHLGKHLDLTVEREGAEVNVSLDIGSL